MQLLVPISVPPGGAVLDYVLTLRISFLPSAQDLDLKSVWKALFSVSYLALWNFSVQLWSKEKGHWDFPSSQLEHKSHPLHLTSLGTHFRPAQAFQTPSMPHKGSTCRWLGISSIACDAESRGASCQHLRKSDSKGEAARPRLLDTLFHFSFIE